MSCVKNPGSKPRQTWSYTRASSSVQSSSMECRTVDEFTTGCLRRLEEDPSIDCSGKFPTPDFSWFLNFYIPPFW